MKAGHDSSQRIQTNSLKKNDIDDFDKINNKRKSIQMDSSWEDDFNGSNTMTLLNNSKGIPTDNEKINIVKVIAWCHHNKTFTLKKFDKIVDNVIGNKTSNFTANDYDLMKSSINNCKSNECFLMHAADCYGLKPRSLLMECIAVNSRVNKLKDSKAWFDNFTLNSFLLQISTIVYHNYDSADNYSVPYNTPPDVINKSIELKIEDQNENENETQKRLLKFLGGEYRTFINFGTTIDDSMQNPLKMLDELVMKYPYFTGCTHGCDVLNGKFSSKSINYDELLCFTKRYPKTFVGYILNTCTYASGKGQHWVALLFRGNDCYLICSCASDFDVFKEDSLKEFIKEHFKMHHFTYKIQHDGSSCGMYSVINTLLFIVRFNENLSADEMFKRLYDEVGSNAEKFNKGGINHIKKILAGYKNEK